MYFWRTFFLLLLLPLLFADDLDTLLKNKKQKMQRLVSYQKKLDQAKNQEKKTLAVAIAEINRELLKINKKVYKLLIELREQEIAKLDNFQDSAMESKESPTLLTAKEVEIERNLASINDKIQQIMQNIVQQDSSLDYSLKIDNYEKTKELLLRRTERAQRRIQQTSVWEKQLEQYVNIEQVNYQIQHINREINYLQGQEKLINSPKQLTTKNPMEKELEELKTTKKNLTDILKNPSSHKSVNLAKTKSKYLAVAKKIKYLEKQLNSAENLTKENTFGRVVQLVIHYKNREITKAQQELEECKKN